MIDAWRRRSERNVKQRQVEEQQKDEQNISSRKTEEHKNGWMIDR
jgi:predicted RNA polymerase sigma factor